MFLYDNSCLVILLCLDGLGETRAHAQQRIGQPRRADSSSFADSSHGGCYRVHLPRRSSPRERIVRRFRCPRTAAFRTHESMEIPGPVDRVVVVNGVVGSRRVSRSANVARTASQRKDLYELRANSSHVWQITTYVGGRFDPQRSATATGTHTVSASAGAKRYDVNPNSQCGPKLQHRSAIKY